jgi:phospholipid/cholesterol/gamma-HCH transport system substrate-binding protein/paraquat-inducible protein B
MSQEQRNFRVGLFVLAGIALVVVFVVLLGGRNFFSRPELVETYFDESVQGLDVGSPVMVRGVQIGRVKEIGLLGRYYDLGAIEQSFDARQKVLVLMELGYRMDLESLEYMIEHGLRLRIAALGITGQSYIEADFLDAEKYPLMPISWEPEHIYVPSAPSRIESIATAAERIAEKLENAEIDALIREVGALVANLNGLALSVKKDVDALDASEIQSRTTALLDDLRRTTGQIDAALEQGNFAKVSSDARHAIEQFDRTLVSLRRAIDGSRDDFEQSLENLRVASENLRAATETARAYPSLLLLGSPPEQGPVSPK